MTTSHTPRWRTGLWIAAALLAVAVGLWTHQRITGQALTLEVAALYPIHRPLPAFTLQDAEGHGFQREQLQGHYSLVFFGYTQCPDVCPITLLELNQVVRALADLPARLQPSVVFVSVDPNRDTPTVLKNYVQHFNASFIGVSGNDTELTTLTRAVGALYALSPSANGTYLVDHSASMFLIDPSAALLAVFPAPHAAHSIEADYRRIVSTAGKTP